MAAKTATIGARIREIRVARNLSQNQLAVRAELHPATISRIETGAHQPTLETLRSIAGALRVGVARLTR